MDTKKRNRFWQLHSILGIALGLPLFVIFVAGTLAFFEPLAINWLHPQYGSPPAEPAPLNPVINRLLERFPATDELSLSPAAPDRPIVDVHLEQNHVGTRFWIDPHSLEIADGTTHEADLFHFFVDLHYFDFIPFGKEITGLIAALFFAIILTGIVYQWRSIRQDSDPRNLSLRRPNRWKMFHRFTSLATLPFQVIYAVTGAALAVGLFLAAPAIYLFFDGKTDALNETLFPGFMQKAPPPVDRPPFPVDEAIAVARKHWPEHVSLERLHIANLAAEGDEAATRTIMLQGKSDRMYFVGGYLLTLDGELNILHDQTPTSHLAPMLIEALANVHFAMFNAPLITAVFVIFGFIVSLSIAAGVIIFLERHRRSSRGSKSFRLLEILTWWTIGGLPLAIAASLHAVHLVPKLPVYLFAATMLLSLVITSLWKPSLSLQSRVAAAGLILLPVTFAVSHGQSPIQWGSSHGSIITLFNLFFPLAALGMLWLTAKLPALVSGKD